MSGKRKQPASNDFAVYNYMTYKENLDKLGIAQRHSVRGGIVQVRGLDVRNQFNKSKFAGDGWRQQSDGDQALIWEKLGMDLGYDPPAGRRKQIVDAHLTANQHDAFLEWLELEVRPHVDKLRYLTKERRAQIDNFIATTRPGAEDVHMLGMRMLCGAIARAYEPAAEHPWMLILAGSGGTGKTELIFQLFPRETRGAWYVLGLKLGESDIKLIDRARDSVFVEASEMDIATNRTWDAIKNMLTQRIDGGRFRYDRFAQAFERRIIVYGTANRVNCIPLDNSGANARRFAVIPIETRPTDEEVEFSREWFNKNRMYVWARALQLYEEDETFNLLPPEAEQHNIYADELDHALQVVSWCDWPKNMAVGEWMSSEDIVTNALELEPGRFETLPRGQKVDANTALLSSGRYERKQRWDFGKKKWGFLKIEQVEIEEE